MIVPQLGARRLGRAFCAIFPTVVEDMSLRNRPIDIASSWYVVFRSRPFARSRVSREKSPRSSCASLIQLGASWTNSSGHTDSWIDIGSGSDVGTDESSTTDDNGDARTPRGSGWTCYVCLQDFTNDQPPIDTQIRPGNMLKCRTCYTFQTW